MAHGNYQLWCRDLVRWVVQEIGLMDWDSPLFKTKGSLQLDLEWAGRRWRTSLGQQVWVLPAEEENWHEVDLHACHFLRDPGEKTVPIGTTESAVEAG